MSGKRQDMLALQALSAWASELPFLKLFGSKGPGGRDIEAGQNQFSRLFLSPLACHLMPKVQLNPELVP
jgi:hypothetical protein